MRETVGEIKRVTEAEGIACDWADGGQLIIARGPQQRPAVDDEYQTMQRLGLADGFELLDADQARPRQRDRSDGRPLFARTPLSSTPANWSADWPERSSGAA